MSIADKQQHLLDDLSLFQDGTERYEYVISLGKKLAPTCVTLPKLSSQFVRFGPSSFPARRGAGGVCRRGRAQMFGKEAHVRARRERASARA